MHTLCLHSTKKNPQINKQQCQTTKTVQPSSPFLKKISKICLSLISHEDNSVGESPSIVVGGVKSFSIDTFM